MELTKDVLLNYCLNNSLVKNKKNCLRSDSLNMLKPLNSSRNSRVSKKIKSFKNYKPTQPENLLDVSEKITDNSSSINKIMNKKPAYLSQFDLQTYDSSDEPCAPNDMYCTTDKTKLADLERQISYDGGWSMYNQDNSMSYGVVPDNKMTHNNMVPFFKTKNGYGTNDASRNTLMNYKNELFTGNMKSTWQNKQESKPLFEPVKNLSYIYGTPIASTEERSRYIPSQYRQNEKLFDDIKVTPGLNLAPDEVGTHGYHSMYRALDKPLEELRVNPKTTYEGRIIEGQRGVKRPIQAPVISYRPETYKTTSEEDLLPTGSVNKGPKSVENFILKETDRANQHIEYTGGAYTKDDDAGRNVPEHMREKYKNSVRQNFTLPKPLQKFSKAESTFNPNMKSYDDTPTMKDLTINNSYIGVAGNPNKSTIYTNHTDVARQTVKETIVDKTPGCTNITPNTTRGIVHNMDIANPTIKETTCINNLNPLAPSLNTVQRVYYSDISRPTIKETTIDSLMPANVVNDINIYANLTDNPRETIKETTVVLPYNTVITPVNQEQRKPNLTDPMKTTMKELTSQIPHHHFITPMDQQQRAANLSDNTRTTTKEITVQTPWNHFMTPVNQEHGPRHLMDITNTTVKETTSQIPHNNYFTPINQQQGVTHLQDIARTTMKERTSQIPYQPNIMPINQQQRAPNYQDNCRQTMKETTVEIPYNTNINMANQYQRTPNLTDLAKSTTKETTIEIPYNTIITPSNRQSTVNLKDLAKSTIKETTVEFPYNTNVMAIAQQQGTATTFDRTPLRNTLKQNTIQIPYNTNTTMVNQTQGKQFAFNMEPLRTTIKEGMIEIPYNTILTPVNQNQGATNLQDNAKSTIKESTVQIPYNTNIKSVNDIGGKANTFNRTPLMTTIKETTIDNEHVSAPTNDVINKGYGYLSENMIAPNTHRQFTCTETFIAPARGEAKNRPYNDVYNAPKDDRKELLHQYRSPTTCGENKGPEVERISVHLKDDNNEYYHANINSTYNNLIDRPLPKSSVKDINSISESRFIDPALLSQLKSNPYNISRF